MHAKREHIAEDIMAYCRKKKKRFVTAKYSNGSIIDSETGVPYSPHQLGNGFRILNELGAARKVSSNRWEILTYKLDKSKK